MENTMERGRKIRIGVNKPLSNLQADGLEQYVA
jgi:hypothetical protein